MESSTFGHVTDWTEVIKKEVRGRNDANLGEVLEVRDDIVVTERGTLNKEKFYLPKSIPHGFNGHTLLFDITEEEAKERFTNESILNQATEIQSTATSTAAADTEKPIPLIEEKLEVSKEETMQEAKIIKEPIKETQTAEVELMHEELIIEKRPVDKTSPSSSTSEGVVQSKTEITIPLKKEDIVVEKKPYVKEEIIIKKKPVSETKTISEQLISEKVSVRNAAGEEVTEEKEGEKEQEE
ncbi:MAG TPA: YsnF/AvaK domain-containing protein [Nitrososphaeraceae archaeon]|nr:YsnF/AvaK domain-containing protein [Nitrososphaeraceae archaeon]